MKLKKSLYALAIAGACSASVSAQTTVIDYPAAGGSFNYLSGYFSPLQFTFTTGSSVAPITGIEVYASSVSSSSVTVSLYQGSASGTLLGTDSLGYGGSGFGSADLTLTGLSTAANTIGAASLSPNTTYALVFNTSGVFSIQADSGLNSGNYTTPTGWAVVGSAYSSGSSWVTWHGAAVSITTGSASPVPEASGSVAGLGLAVAGLYQLGRRRQKTVTQ